MAEAERKFVSQSIRFETEDQFNQLEAALLGAGYHWYLNARDTAQKNRIVNLGCDGSVCGVLNSGAAIPFAEGMALLGSPVEEKADPPAPRMEWRDARVEDVGKGLKLRATTTERLQWCGEDSHWDRLGVNPRGGFAVHGVPWKYVQVLAPAEDTHSVVWKLDAMCGKQVRILPDPLFSTKGFSMSNSHKSKTESWWFKQTPSMLMMTLGVEVDGKVDQWEAHGCQINVLCNVARRFTDPDGRIKLFRELEFAEARYETAITGGV